jgi:pimeloyl-ACP methyl ester carboxylesterase
MIELLQHVVNLEWRRRGAAVRQVRLAGSLVWYAEFQPKPGAPATAARAVHAPDGARRRVLLEPPTVVLFHGLGASSMSFHSVIPQLRRAYRVIVPDLPGCGFSRPPKGREFLPFPELVDVAEKFVARIAPRGAYVVGNSMGGWITVKLASRRPDLVRGIALLNPGGPALRAEDWVDFARIMMAEERGAVDEWLQRVFHKPPLMMRFFMSEVRRILRGPPVGQLIATLTAEDFLSEEEMAQVRCPAVLVWGERDRLIPEGCRAFYLRKLKGVRYEPIPDCGHCPQLECPDRTAEILLDLPSASAKRSAPAPVGARGGGAASTPVPSRRRGGVRAVARAPKS